MLNGERLTKRTMSTRLEHANMQVRDVEAMLHFLRTAFPDWRIRHDEADDDGRCRVYFADNEGNDREFVQYLSKVPAERNDYELDENPEAEVAPGEKVLRRDNCGSLQSVCHSGGFTT